MPIDDLRDNRSEFTGSQKPLAPALPVEPPTHPLDEAYGDDFLHKPDLVRDGGPAQLIETLRPPRLIDLAHEVYRRHLLLLP